MLLVAAIVILGIRSFFVQPFIIPTNSMYPSFFGMTPHVYEEKPPSLLKRSVDKIIRGASHYQLEAESSGTLYLVLQSGSSHRYVKQNFPQWALFYYPNNGQRIYF